MNSVMFAARCLRRSVRDIGVSHFRPTRFQIQLTPSCNTTSSLTHTHTQPPHASRSISEHCVIILNLITSGLSDGGPVLPNHICIEWPKAEEVRPDSSPPLPSPHPPMLETSISHSCMVAAIAEHLLLPVLNPITHPLPTSKCFAPPEIDSDIQFFLTPDTKPYLP